MSDASAPTLVPLATIVVELRPPALIGDFSPGTRVLFEVAEGLVDGDRLQGKVAGNANGDWLRVAPGGVGHVDVRMLVETHDGAQILMQYSGRTDLNQGGAAPVYVAPTFETFDERYTWLNGIQAVGKGTLVDQTLTYVLSEVQ